MKRSAAPGPGTRQAVRVVFDPTRVSYEKPAQGVLGVARPMQGMRQGHDVGTQYRSAIFYKNEEQREAAEASAEAYGKSLATARFGAITTEIVPAREFYNPSQNGGIV